MESPPPTPIVKKTISKQGQFLISDIATSTVRSITII